MDVSQHKERPRRRHKVQQRDKNSRRLGDKVTLPRIDPYLPKLAVFGCRRTSNTSEDRSSEIWKVVVNCTISEEIRIL